MKCPRQHNFFRLHKAATERMQGKLLLCFGIWAVPAEQTHPKGWHCWGAAQHQGCHCKYPGHQICTCWGLCLSFGGDLSGSNIDQKDSKLNLRVIVQKVPAAGVTWDYRNCSSAEASGLSQAWSPSNQLSSVQIHSWEYALVSGATCSCSVPLFLLSALITAAVPTYFSGPCLFSSIFHMHLQNVLYSLLQKY